MKKTLIILFTLLVVNCFAQKTVNTNGNQTIWDTKTFNSAVVVPQVNFNGSFFVIHTSATGGLIISNTITGGQDIWHTNGNHYFSGSVLTNEGILHQVGDLVGMNSINGRYGFDISRDYGYMFAGYPGLAGIRFRSGTTTPTVFDENNDCILYAAKDGVGNWTAKTNVIVWGYVSATNGYNLPVTVIAPTDITNGMARLWNSNGVVFLRTSTVGTTTEGTDLKLAP